MTLTCARLREIRVARTPEDHHLLFQCSIHGCDFSCNSKIGMPSYKESHSRRTASKAPVNEQPAPAKEL